MSSLAWAGASFDRGGSGRSGVHTSVVTDRSEERDELLGLWLSDAVKGRSRVLIAASRPQSALDVGVQLGEYDESWGASVADRLVVHDLATELFAGRSFAARPLLDLLEEAARRAFDDGYRSLRVFADMTWAWRAGADESGLLDLERGLHELLEAQGAPGAAGPSTVEGAAVAAVCHYDRRRFPEDLLDRIAGAHAVHVDPAASELEARAVFKVLPGATRNELRLEGELDLAGIDALEGAFEATPSGPLVVDLGALTFCDAAGLGAICKPARHGRPTVLRHVQPFQRALLDLLGYTSLEAVSLACPQG